MNLISNCIDIACPNVFFYFDVTIKGVEVHPDTQKLSSRVATAAIAVRWKTQSQTTILGNIKRKPFGVGRHAFFKLTLPPPAVFLLPE